MPSICWWDHQRMVHWHHSTWLRLDFCEMSKKFSASGVPKTLGRPSSYFHRAVGGTQVLGKASFFLKVDPKPGENVGFKGLKVWWLVGWSFSSDASFFFRVFFWWWCFSLAKEKLKLYNSWFFSEVDPDVSIPIQFYTIYTSRIVIGLPILWRKLPCLLFVSFFFKGITIVVSNIHPSMFLMTEVTFSMAAALGMKDLTADYHLFQARDVGNSRVERKSVAFFFFLGGGREYIGFCAWEILEWCSEVQWDMLLLLLD